MKSATPISRQQLQFWVHGQAAGETGELNLLWAVDIHGQVDPDRLSQALCGVMAKYPVLRSRILPGKATPCVEIDPAPVISLSVDDLSHLPPDLVERRIIAFGSSSYDPVQRPLYRFRLVRLGAADWTLLCGFHHLVMDGYSWPIFLRDVSRALSGEDLGAEPTSYADYCARQARHHAAGLSDADRAYWHGVSAAAYPWPVLPADSEGRSGQDTGVAVRKSLLDQNLCTVLSRHARDAGMSPFRCSLAAFAVWLARLTQEQAVRVATTLTGRAEPADRNVLGLCVTLGLTDVRVTPESSFREVTAAVSKSLDAAVRHQSWSSGAGLMAVGDAELAQNARNAGVSFVKIPRRSTFEAAGLRLSDRRIFLPFGTRDLSVYWQDEGGRVTLHWVYRSDKFLAASISDFAEQFQHVMRQCLQDPDGATGRFHLVPGAQQARIARLTRGPRSHFPLDRPIFRCIEVQAEIDPDRTAVVDGLCRMSYRQLLERSAILAGRLQQMGLRRGDLVPLVLPSSAALLVAELAVMRAGGAFVPVDPAWPRARRDQVLAQLSSGVAIAGHPEDLGGLSVQVVHLDPDGLCRSDLVGDPAPVSEADLEGDDTIYCIFTSGSTGVPKGALNTHRAVANRLHVMTERFAQQVPPIVLAAAPGTVDTHVWQYFWPLMVGGRSVILPREKALSAQAVLATCAAERISLLDFVPALFRDFVNHLRQDAGLLSQIDSVRTVVIGGDSIELDPVHWLRIAAPAIEFVNTYGPTETAIATVMHMVSPHDRASSIIGRPIANTTIAVLDPYLNLVPIGVPGEICIGGVAVGKGYLGLPDETERRFVTVTGSGPAQRLYRTGDRGRVRRDGTIEFLGRLDHQINLNGNRIEPVEVEIQLLQYPGVVAAAVCAVEGKDGRKRLRAFVVAPGQDWLSADLLRRHLLDRLPRHAVPTEFRLIEDLPRGASGKLDRSALADMVGRPIAASDGNRAATCPVTLETIDIWQEVLGRTGIGPDDDFFVDLGGDSLSALACELLAEKKTGRKPDLQRFFENPTPAALALWLRNPSPAETVVPTCGIDGILERQRVFLSNWKGDRSGPQSFLYTLNGGNDRSAVFWCCQGYEELAALAAQLGPEQPVTGMRSGHLVMDYSAANKSALAQIYANEMNCLQPDGAFVLGGNCQAGDIMREVMAKLLAMGRKVGRLIILEDTAYLPAEVPVTLIFGKDSHLNPFRDGRDPSPLLAELYPQGHDLVFIPGGHGQFFRPPSIEPLATAIARHKTRQPA